jgi:hypothetical protein
MQAFTTQRLGKASSTSRRQVDVCEQRLRGKLHLVHRDAVLCAAWWSLPKKTNAGSMDASTVDGQLYLSWSADPWPSPAAARTVAGLSVRRRKKASQKPRPAASLEENIVPRPIVIPAPGTSLLRMPLAGFGCLGRASSDSSPSDGTLSPEDNRCGRAKAECVGASTAPAADSMLSLASDDARRRVARRRTALQFKV